MKLDIDIEDWPEGDWEQLAARVVRAAQMEARELANPRLTVSILFTSDAEVHALNRQWRAKDRPTNVLSFPMLTREELLDLAPDGSPELPPVPLGDIVLAHGVCAREAAEKGVSLENHAAHLITHGLLHLAGHDHEISPEDAEAMEKLEIAVLAKLGIANPYKEPDDPD